MQGTIKKLVQDKGYGFIGREGETKDLFFHAKDLQGVQFESLREGDAVTFEVQEGPKGLFAAQVARA